MRNKSKQPIQYIMCIVIFLHILSTLTFFSYYDITVCGARLAPDIKAVDIEGNLFQLANVTSQVILLDFFTTTCPPCRRAITDFKELYTSYTRNELEIVSISPEDNITLQNFAHSPDVNMAWIIISDYDGAISNSYLGNDGRIPHLYLVDNDSYIRYDHIGWAGESDATIFRSKIDSILSGEISNGDDNPAQDPTLPIIIISVVIIIFIAGLFMAGQYLGWSKPSKKRRKKQIRVINQLGG